VSTKQAYWKMKKDELISILIEKNIPFDPDKFDRKVAIDQLVEMDAAAGLLEEPVELNDEEVAGPPKIRREYVDIVFRNQDGEPKYVPLGLQGRFLYLPRECLCRIPAEFMEVVRHAVTDKIVQYEKDGKLHQRTVRVPRLVYEIVDRGVI